MFKVKNKKTINKLAKTSFRANMFRNIVAIISIILTTVLFTGLFTVVSSMFASMEASTMRQVGSNAHSSFKYLAEEQYDKLKTHESIKDVSYSVVLGIAENKELAKRISEIRFANDEIEAAGTFALPTTGTMPKNDNEIATDTIVLEHLGIPAELGQKITLEYSVGGEKRTDTFTLVGFWQGDKLMMASMVWLNRTYVEKQLEGYDPAESNYVIGTRNASVNFANSFNIENKILKVIEDSGYTKDDIEYGVNWAYAGGKSSVEPTTILGGVVVVLMITFCGYLIISNVFYISVAKDTRYYGLLKTIGTTGKQIRFLIRRQALQLCAVGVPLGLVAGFFVGSLLTPIILSILNTNVIKISINPIVLVASAVFAIVTVAISIRKPSKIAARVSPIEALRSTDGAQKSKKATRKSVGISPLKMASANIGRNRKKAVLVTISLSLSLIILNSAYSMANSFDMDKYLNNMIGSDFAIGDVSFFNVHIRYTDQGTLTPEFLKILSEKSGIEEMSNIYFSEPETETDPRLAGVVERAEKEIGVSGDYLEDMKYSLRRDFQTQHIYGIDDDVFKRLEIFSGEIDIDKLKTGNYIISSPFDTEGRINYYNVGDRVNVTNVDGEVKEYEVLAVAKIPYNISNQHSHPISIGLILPTEIFLQSIANKAPMLTTLEMGDGFDIEMESFISDYCENINTDMQYKSKATLVAEYENTQKTYKSVGMILSLLVAFIGVMNFINTTVTSIMARKRELAMLQSIGMTSRQMETMLVVEGLIYTLLTAVFAVTVGSVLGYIGVNSLTGGTYFTLRFTVIPSLLCLPILALISAAVPFISQRIVNSSSVVERLREAE